MGRATSCQQQETSVKISMNASTVISAVMGNAETQRAPSAVSVTMVTERPPLEITAKISMNAWRTIVFAKEETALIPKGPMIVPVQRDSSSVTTKHAKILMSVNSPGSVVLMESV